MRDLELKPFLDILRRATHCSYPSVILNNRILMQCYDLSIDSEVGLHYIQYIPDDIADTAPDFYDQSLTIKPRQILNVYREGHRALLDARTEKSLPAKAASETLQYKIHKHHVELTFTYTLAGEEIDEQTCNIAIIDESIPEVENCLRNYGKLIDRIKLGGACLVFNGSRLGLQSLITDCPEIYRYKIKYQGKKLVIPFTKSMFLGIKDPSRFLFSIQESTMDDIYIYSIQLEAKGIIEQFWGYVLQY